MKTTILLLFCFMISTTSYAQKRVATDLSFVTATGLDNKFFKNSFKMAPGIKLGVNIRINDDFSAALDFRKYFLGIKNPEFYGNFTHIYMVNFNIGAKYKYNFNQNVDLEAKLLFGAFEMSGEVYGFQSQYTQTGLTFGAFGNAVYHIDQKGTVDLIGGLGIQQMHSNIKIDDIYHEKFYNNSLLIIPEFGVRLNF